MMKKNLTTTQIGTIGEHLAASQLMLASKGRLSVFLPMADDDGIDLLVFDKITRSTLPIQIKSRTSIDAGTRGTVQFDVRRKTMSTGSYLLALLFDWQLASVQWAWLVPMGDLEKISQVTTSKLSIRPSASSNSRDRYRHYRHDGMHSVSTALSTVFDRS